MIMANCYPTSCAQLSAARYGSQTCASFPTLHIAMLPGVRLSHCASNLNSNNCYPSTSTRMMQVLTDLCNVSGPFSKVLRTVRTELVRSVYSDYYAMEQQGLQFSQLPYYKAAERLEADNKHLLQEKDAFKKVLLRRQVQ